MAIPEDLEIRRLVIGYDPVDGDCGVAGVTVRGLEGSGTETIIAPDPFAHTILEMAGRAGSDGDTRSTFGFSPNISQDAWDQAFRHNN